MKNKPKHFRIVKRLNEFSIERGRVNALGQPVEWTACGELRPGCFDLAGGLGDAMNEICRKIYPCYSLAQHALFNYVYQTKEVTDDYAWIPCSEWSYDEIAKTDSLI